MEQSGEDRRPLSPGRAENGEKSCSPKHDFRRPERRKLFRVSPRIEPVPSFWPCPGFRPCAPRRTPRNPSPCAPLPRWRSLAEGKEQGIPVFYCNFYAKKIRGIRQEMTGFGKWKIMVKLRAERPFFCVVEGRGESVLGFLREGLGPSFLGFVGDFVEYDRKILWRQVP